jgi:1,2-phenylacetyl-CoA epoxidase PaaB subunit
MEVFEVFQRRTHDDPLVSVGSIKAPDVEFALLLARETHFRHGEGAECWIARREDLHAVPHPETMGGVTDHSYRRQDGYVGVGAKHKRIAAELKTKGQFIEGKRPPAGVARDGH